MMRRTQGESEDADDALEEDEDEGDGDGDIFDSGGHQLGQPATRCSHHDHGRVHVEPPEKWDRHVGATRGSPLLFLF